MQFTFFYKMLNIHIYTIIMDVTKMQFLILVCTIGIILYRMLHEKVLKLNRVIFITNLNTKILYKICPKSKKN